MLCIHIIPLVLYRCSKYHLPMSLVSELDVHIFRYKIYPLKTSCKPYMANGNMSFLKPLTYHGHPQNVCDLNPAEKFLKINKKYKTFYIFIFSGA